MRDRGEEIERFFWLLVRLCSLAFGYLLMLIGVLVALVFVVEQLRTGMISLNGAEYEAGLTRLWLTLVPVLVVVLGVALVVLARSKSKDT